MKTFYLPDLGEGLTDAEIAEWHVKEGDIVKLDQSLISMETAKALVEIPSPFSGRIIKLYGKPGDRIKTGGSLVEFETDEEDNKENDKNKIKDNDTLKNKNKDENKVSDEDRGTVAGRLETSDKVYTEPTFSKAARSASGLKVTPAVRALAQRLKVDLIHITPTGPEGTITSQDVELAAKRLETAAPMELFKGIRRSMAQTMENSRDVVPVTVVEDAKLFNWSKDEDITVRLMQAMIYACQQVPTLNAWYYSKEMGYRLIPSIHLGIAMDTSDGLFVPVIHHAEKLDPAELRLRLNNLKSEVQSRKISPENLQGATITLSNFGKFSGRYANPIIIPPMVAILGVGRIRIEPTVIQNEIHVCPILPLSLTVDHRAVTGGEATRFLGKVIEHLEK